MSISNIRKGFEGKGCQVALVVIGVLMIVGMIVTPGFFDMFGGKGNDPNDPVIAKVGGQAIPASAFDKALENATNTLSTQGYNSSDPDTAYLAHLQAVNSVVSQVALRDLAKERGVQVTEADARTIWQDTAKQQIEFAKQNLMMSGQVKPDAPANEIAQQFEKAYGQSEEEMLKGFNSRFDDELKRATDQQEFLNGFLPDILSKKYIAEASVTEESVKKGFDTFDFDEIAFDDDKVSLADRQKQAEEALAKIKGGADFKAIQDEYAKNSKRKATALSRAQMETNPDLKLLLELKEGETSEIVSVFGHPSILKLKTIKSDVPETFEASKAMLIEQQKQQRGQEKFTEAIRAKIEKLDPKFEDPSLQVMYRIVKFTADDTLIGQPEKVTEQYQAFYEDAKAAKTGSSASISAVLMYGLAKQLDLDLTGEAKKEFQPELLEAYEEALVYYESLNLRLAIAKLNAENSDPDAALGQIKTSIENIIDYDANGDAQRAQVVALVAELEKNKLFSKEQSDQIIPWLRAWDDAKKKYEADQKALDAAGSDVASELDKLNEDGSESATNDNKKPESTSDSGN